MSTCSDGFDALYVDAHCHRTSGGGNIGLVSVDMSDFDALLDLPRYYSLGIHPWFIERQKWPASIVRIANLPDATGCLAIGECGLDRSIDVPLPLQIDVFRRQIELADRLNKPLVVHCVRAFDELLRIKKASRSRVPWIIHGFTGKWPLAQQLLGIGCYLSLGAALFDERSHARTVLTEAPLQQLFLETDDSGMQIGVVYEVAAKILDLDIRLLQRQMIENFHRVFIDD